MFGKCSCDALLGRYNLNDSISVGLLHLLLCIKDAHDLNDKHNEKNDNKGRKEWVFVIDIDEVRYRHIRTICHVHCLSHTIKRSHILLAAVAIKELNATTKCHV